MRGPDATFPSAPVPIGHEEETHPVQDMLVAILGLSILALCWTAVWVLLSQRFEVGTAREGSGLLALLQELAQQFLQQRSGPVP